MIRFMNDGSYEYDVCRTPVKGRTPNHDCYVVVLVRERSTFYDGENPEVHEVIRMAVGYYIKDNNTFYLSDDEDSVYAGIGINKVTSLHDHIIDEDFDGSVLETSDEILQWLEIDELNATGEEKKEFTA